MLRTVLICIHKCDSSTRVETTPKRSKGQFKKKDTSFKETSEPKSTRQPLKSKALVPLKVDVLPAPLKGALKKEQDKTVGNKRVSFNCDPEIRYRTASDTSSTSTLKSTRSQKGNGLNFKTEQYSTDFQMASNKNAKSKSVVEKRFDDLLNSKCSWTYKSVKTIKCETMERQNDEKGPVLKVKTMNIKETAYGPDPHRENPVHLADEYEYFDPDTKRRAKKNIKPLRKSRNSKLVGSDSIKRNRNTSQPRDNNVQMISRTKRNLKDVSYAESDSSSDDGIVFLSRSDDGRMANGARWESDDMNEVSKEMFSNVSGDENDARWDNDDMNEVPREMFSNMSGDERGNNIEISPTNSEGNYSETDNFKASVKQNFNPQSCEELENNSDQEESKTHCHGQDAVQISLFDDDYLSSNSNRSSVVNQVSEKEIDFSPSETVSSLSEWGGNNPEEGKGKDTPTRKERNENANCKNDQNLKITRQFMNVSTEVQAVSDEFEVPNDNEDDELIDDFFSGNFNLEKYRSITREQNENGSYKSKLLNKTRSDDAMKTYSNQGRLSNEEIRALTNRYSDTTKDTKVKSKKLGNTLNPRNSTTAKGQRGSYLDTSSEQGDNDEAENDLFGESEYSEEHSGSCTSSRRKSISRISDNAKHKQSVEEIISRSKNASNVRNLTKVKEQSTLHLDGDRTFLGQSSKDEELRGSEHSVIDSPRTYSDKTRKQANKNSNNAKDTKGKCKKHYLDGDRTSLGQGSEDEELQRNEYSAIDSTRGMRSDKTRKDTTKNSDNAKDTKGKSKKPDSKINSKNENARCSSRLKEQHTLDLNWSEQSDEDETEEDEYSATDDYFKEGSLKMADFNESTKKYLDSEMSRLEPEVGNVKAHQLLDAKRISPQRRATSWTNAKENLPSGNIKDGNRGQCSKRNAPKTWEDLEADILNREEQISFFPLFETPELFPIGEAFAQDEKFHHTRKNKNTLGSRCRLEGTSEIEKAKPQHKWATAESRKRNSCQLTSSTNANSGTFDSPNAGIIDRVIRRMQMATSPVLTPSKVLPQLEEPQKSSIIEYSYLVQATKSVLITTEKKLDGKKTGKSKTANKGHTARNMNQKNYRLRKEQEIKTVINPNKATVTNQTSVKLNEIRRRKLSKSSESDDGPSESVENSEMKSSTPESDKSLSCPRGFNTDGSYNLRKRKCNINVPYGQSATKKQNVTKSNVVAETISMPKNKQNKIKKRGKQNSIRKPTGGNEDFTSLNKKRGNKCNFVNHSEDNESESDGLFQNGASATDGQERHPETKKSHLKLTRTSNKGVPQQKNALPQSAQVRSMKAKRPRPDSKEEYETYLRKFFSKHAPEDFNVQRKLPGGTNEPPNKGNKSAKNLSTSDSDVEFFSVSSDTESDEENPSQRRATGLLDEVFD